MLSLEELVSHLTPGELLFIKAYYKLKWPHRLCKRLRLLNWIEAGNSAAIHPAINGVNQQKANAALSKLKERLKKDILNLLMLLPFSSGHLPVCSKKELDCTKLLLQGKLLLARDMIPEATDLLGKAARMAKEFELYELCIDANDTLRTRCLGLGEAAVGERCHQQIANAHRDHHDLLLAKELYQQMLRTSCGDQVDHAGATAKSRMGLRYLGQRLKRMPSKRIAFWYYMASLKYDQAVDQLLRAEDHCQRLYHLVRKCPLIFSPSAERAILNEWANVCLRLEKWSEAEEKAVHALALAKKASVEELEIHAILFAIYLKSGDFNKANSKAEELINHPRLGKKKRLIVVVQLSQSSIEFEKGQYKQSIRRLNQVSKISKDPFHMALVKYLELLNIIEVGDLDWLEYKLEAFRKFLSRLRHRWVPGFVGIHHAMQVLLRNGFDYEQLSGQLDALSTELRGIENELSKSLPGCHWIDFRTWLMKKVHLLGVPGY